MQYRIEYANGYIGWPQTWEATLRTIHWALRGAGEHVARPTRVMRVIP